jgi:transcriptional regulator GlxA family with amidase domain
MEEVGFLDAAHFSKLFKLGTGYTPTKFRKALSNRKNTVI